MVNRLDGRIKDSAGVRANARSSPGLGSFETSSHSAGKAAPAVTTPFCSTLPSLSIVNRMLRNLSETRLTGIVTVSPGNATAVPIVSFGPCWAFTGWPCDTRITAITIISRTWPMRQFVLFIRKTGS